VYRKKTTEGYQSTPYVVTLFSSMLWILYAVVKSNAVLLVTVNGVGCVIETAYIAMYLAYAPKASRVVTARMLLGLNVGLFGAVALLTRLLSSKGTTLRVHVLGWICVSVAVAVFAAPLSIMVRDVVTHRLLWFKRLFLTILELKNSQVDVICSAR
jgi:solute carrier family 50 (sugar transporter)